MNSEPAADCFAVKQMRAFGILNNPMQLQALAQELSSLSGSPSGHLPGPLRAQNVINCALF